MKLKLAFGLFMIFASAMARAENWPAWRGPRGNGVSGEKNPPVQWSNTENVTWKAAPKGTGSSTPIIWGDRIFLTAQTEDEVEWILGLSRSDGKILWEREGGKGTRRTRAGANMASPSPVTDGEVVVASFGTGDVFAFDLDGKPLWKRNIETDNGKITVWWGYSSSPVLYKDIVLITVINEGPSYLLALDKQTGEVKWKTDRKTPATSEACDAYVTPLVYDAGGKTEVFLAGATWATGYDAAGGKLLWQANLGGDRTIVSPTYADGVIYVTAGKRGPLFAIKPGGAGEVDSTHVAWKYLRSTPDVPCPLVFGDYVYFVNDSGMALCLKKSDGELVYQKRLGGDFKASPVAAGGKLYFLNREGETTVVEPGPEFKVLAVNKLEEAAAMGSMAFSDGQIFLRTVSSLYCIGPKGK